MRTPDWDEVREFLKHDGWVSLPLWLAYQLQRRGISAAEIETLDERAATDLLNALRSRSAD